MSLFDSLPAAQQAHAQRPLAERMRPRSLEEFAGQEHILGEGKPLRRLIDEDRVPSLILWGPPGVGKTTLANLIALRTKADDGGTDPSVGPLPAPVSPPRHRRSTAPSPRPARATGAARRRV